MPKILCLDAHVANLIAAGEVVERPASVVKELVENAIDAGACRITVEIQNGGMTFLRVTDDGCGMTPEDAKTAFLRHATSKLRTCEDLAAIGTLGFRGEALAAIASVSRIELLTRTPDGDPGVSLTLEAGRITSEAPAGCSTGTTLVVRDLFYNTPARMKFMKSDSAEGAAVFAAVQRLALSHPEISFRFIKDGSEQLHTAGDKDLMGTVYQVLGRQTANDMLAVDSHWEKISVHGFVTRPTATRGNRTFQHFFVNGRSVKSKMLAAALEEAYKNQIMTGRFPACVLTITLPADAVDVNVHPAKTEVKFLSERSVFDAVHYGVLSTLSKASAKPEMKLSAPARPAAAPEPSFFQTMTAGQLRASTKSSALPLHNAQVQIPSRTAPSPVKAPAARPVQVIPDELEALLMTAQKKAPERDPDPQPVQPPKQEELAMQELSFRIIGEALDTYILVEQDQTLLFVDKHAAHERILFERLKQQGSEVMSQMLLMPLAAGLGREEAAAVLENAVLLERCGYGVEDFGDGTVLLRRIPCDLDPQDAEASLAELAQRLLQGQDPDPQALHDELLHCIACKAAIKAGYHTQPQEREALVREVLSRDDLKYCPHGRPICITLTQRQLEKQFKRV